MLVPPGGGGGRAGGSRRAKSYGGAGEAAWGEDRHETNKRRRLSYPALSSKHRDHDDAPSPPAAAHPSEQV